MNKYTGELKQLSDQAKAELKKMQDIYGAAKQSPTGVTMQTINEMYARQNELFMIMDKWNLAFRDKFPRKEKRSRPGNL